LLESFVTIALLFFEFGLRAKKAVV